MKFVGMVGDSKKFGFNRGTRLNCVHFFYLFSKLLGLSFLADRMQYAVLELGL